jgi:hypothetical protein
MYFLLSFGGNGQRVYYQTRGRFYAQMGEFVIAGKTCSSMPALWWMREIRLAIRLLTSLALPLVSV